VITKVHEVTGKSTPKYRVKTRLATWRRNSERTRAGSEREMCPWAISKYFGD
jgi:hypothetical protein